MLLYIPGIRPQEYALHDSTDPNHREHHRLVLGQFQILANRSRIDDYRQPFIQGYQCKLIDGYSSKRFGGRIFCIQFVFRVLAVIYSWILNNKVVLIGFLELKGLRPEVHAAAASNDSSRGRPGINTTTLTSKGGESFGLLTKGS